MWCVEVIVKSVFCLSPKLLRLLVSCPVSYTHLDVYKRQVFRSSFLPQGQETVFDSTSLRGRCHFVERTAYTRFPEIVPILSSTFLGIGNVVHKIIKMINMVIFYYRCLSYTGQIRTKAFTFLLCDDISCCIVSLCNVYRPTASCSLSFLSCINLLQK